MTAPPPIGQFVNYVIYFSNQATYNAALALIQVRVRGNPNQATLAPAEAAKIFNFVEGVNYNIAGNTLNSVMGMYGISPYYLGIPKVEINNPNPSGVYMDGTILSVTVPGQNGSPDIPSNRNPSSLVLTWCATFTYINTTSIATGNANAAIPLRRWINGFEFDGSIEGGTPPGGVGYSRDSSRTADGVGLALRNTTNFNYLQNVGEFITPVNASNSWERIYMRVRTFGSSPIDFWKSLGNPSGDSGIRLYLNEDGTVTIKNVNVSNVETTLGTTPSPIFILNQFLKLDLILNYNGAASGGSGNFTLFVNGVQISIFNVTVAAGGIGGNSQTHESTLLGTQLASATGWEIDFDDWHNAEVPTTLIGAVNIQTLTSADWTGGTHVRAQKINTGTIGSFTGNLQSTNQMMNPANVPSTSELTSTTSSDVITGVTDTNDTSDPLGSIICASAALIGTYFNVAGGTPSNTQLGYSLAGASTVNKNVSDSTSATWKSVLWSGNGTLSANPTIAPFSISLTKAANTDKITILAFSCEVQYIGVWGVEDNSQTALPQTFITHNAWFPDIINSFLGPTSGPVFAAAVGGTYVGNGTTQAIVLPFPPCFLWIRPVANNNGGVKWFGASLSSHAGGTGAMRPDLVPRMDSTSGTITFTVVGSALENNQNAVTYQYIAFCDPSFQFNLTGAWLHNSSDLADVNDLLDSSFLPISVFYSFDKSNNDATNRLIYKGPGHTTTDANIIDGTALTNSGSFTTGSITSGTDNQNSAGNQINFSAFNGTNGCGQTMFQILSYTGNGATSQVIALTPTSNRYPLFVYVQPHNAVGFVCDPSDISPSSRQITAGTPSNTAIESVGVDQITVGSTLNSNGITYEVFVICGDTAGFNNGTFQPIPCGNIASLVPAPGQILPGNIVITPVGGIEFDGATAVSLLKDVSGIYQLIKGQTHDVLLDRQPNQVSIDVPIPASFKTGYIGG